LALLALVAGLRAFEAGGQAAASEPNVVLIVADDMRADQMVALPSVRKLIAGRGVTFKNAYVTYPICCPSRASLLTGLYLHNHGVRGNKSPTGGWRQFHDTLEDSALPTRLQADGYTTTFAGKYMNGYGKSAPFDLPPRPQGWDNWNAATGWQPNRYTNFLLAEGAAGSADLTLRQYAGGQRNYLTDVLAQRFANQLTQGPSSDPVAGFFWPLAPHAPWVPAKRHIGRWNGRKLPKIPNAEGKGFATKPAWLQEIIAVKGQGRRGIEKGRRRAMEQLLAVDAGVRRLVRKLEVSGRLDDTYLIFTSDNGYFRGELRIEKGKYLPHEPSSHVPLLISGPGIPKGGVSKELVSLADIPQTILEVTEGSQDPSLDGRSLLPFARDPLRTSNRPLLIEADTGRGGIDDGGGGIGVESLRGLRGVDDIEQEAGMGYFTRRGKRKTTSAPAYKAIRYDRYLYVAYADGSEELYDLRADRGQAWNLAVNPAYDQVREWLTARLTDLAECAGTECRRQIGAPPTPTPPLG